MSANSYPNHYTVLGVARNATLPEIRSAYKKLALKLHPDKAGDGKETTAKFRKVAEAVDVLSNSVLRRNHDELLDRSALTDPGKFGIRSSYASPAATDKEDWTGQGKTNLRQHWSTRPWEEPCANSRENPYDKPPPRPHHTQPRPAQSREPSRPRRPDIWEEYLNGSRLNGMKYGPDTTNALPAYNKWQQKPFSKQKFQKIFREPKSGVPMAENSSQRGAPRQSANSFHPHQSVPDIYTEALEARIKAHIKVLQALVQVHEEQFKHESFFEHHLSTRDEGFGNIPKVPNNDEGSVNLAHMTCFQGAEYKCRVHAPDDVSFVDSSAAKGGDGLSDEDYNPRPSFPSQGDGSADEGTNLSNHKRKPSPDEIVFLSCVDSPGSLESGERVDSTKLTDDDSDGGIILPTEDLVLNPVDNADEELLDKSGDYKSFVPFIPFYQEKLREPNGRYNSKDLCSELEGLVKQAFNNAQRHKEEPLSNPNPDVSLTPNSAKVCSHVNLWVRQLDRPECKVCNIFKPLYVLKCSGCDAMVCVRCKFQKTA